MTSEREEESAVLADLTRKGRPKLPALTGIRGWAALWVVIYHAWLMATDAGAHIPPRDVVPVINRGYLGVDLFFTLSGFVLMLTYGRSVAQDRWTAVRRFAIGRAFRILPLHWAVLLLFLAAMPIVRGLWLSSGALDLSGFVASVFLVQSWILRPGVWNVPTWSLSCEMLAYISFPLIAPIVLGLGRRVALGALAVAFVPLAVAAFATHPAGFDHIRILGLVRCIVEFPMGMLLCQLWRVAPPSRGLAQALFAGGVLLFAVALISVNLDLVAVAAFALIIFSCAAGSRATLAVFANPVSHFLGEVSYSIYLIHILVLNVAIALARLVLSDMGEALAAGFAAGLAATVPLAWVAWRFIEVPGQAYGRVVMQRSGRRTAVRVG